MSNSNQNFMSYNTGTLIPSGGQRPPPPIMTQRDPNLQTKQVFHQKLVKISLKELVEKCLHLVGWVVCFVQL